MESSISSEIEDYYTNINNKYNNRYEIIKNLTTEIKNSNNDNVLIEDLQNLSDCPYKKLSIESYTNYNEDENDNKINFINYQLISYSNELIQKKKISTKKLSNNIKQKRIKSKELNNILDPIFKLDNTKWDRYKIDKISDIHNISKITIYKWNNNKWKWD